MPSYFVVFIVNNNLNWGWACKIILGLFILMNFLGHSVVTPQLISGFLDAGFEEGIRDMKPGGKRRLIIPPELGPPVCFVISCMAAFFTC